MPSVDDLTPLFRAISHKSWPSVQDEAKSVALRLEEKGQHTAARTLRSALVSTNGAAHRFNSLTTVNGLDGIPPALKKISLDIDLNSVRLCSKTRSDVEQFIREWQFKNQLAERGLSPRRRLLFHGPPGCGKSLCAKAIGNTLGLPVYVLRFDSAIGSLLGQTAANLRSVFDYCEQHSSILLIDEIDALGRHRGQSTDVGELDRVVISLMQELEHNQTTGIVIGTCNLPKDLDRALWRRFDSHLQFPLPTKAGLTRYAKCIAESLNIALTAELMQALSKRISYSDAEKIIEAEARRLVLEEV